MKPRPKAAPIHACCQGQGKPACMMTYSLSCHLISNTIDQKWFRLPSIFRRHLTLTLLSYLIITHMSWLQLRKGSLHFILSDDSNNYNSYVKVKCCRFVGFVKDVIDCECLRCVFCFRIKEKEKIAFYINFYSTIFLQNCFLFLITWTE